MVHVERCILHFVEKMGKESPSKSKFTFENSNLLLFLWRYRPTLIFMLLQFFQVFSMRILMLENNPSFVDILSKCLIYKSSGSFALPIKMFLKVAFFRKCDSFFKSPNLKKKYSKKLSWTWNLNFKLRIVWNIFILEIWKTNSLFLKKKPPLGQ